MSRMIISLSSIPPRFESMGPTLQALLAQSDPADAIYVYIPKAYRRFSDWDGVLPNVPEGVEIRRCETDLGPATKVLAAAREFQGEDVDILFCDDDRIYPHNLVSRFRRNRRKHPDAAIANLGVQAYMLAPSEGLNRPQPRTYRSWRITDVEFQLKYLWRQALARSWDVKEPARRVFKRSGYIDIFEGCGAVLVRPEMFDEIAYDIPPVLWSVDDVWLSGMLARRGIPIWLHGNVWEPELTEAHDLDPLCLSVIDGADRFGANRQAVEYMQQNYQVWL